MVFGLVTATALIAAIQLVVFTSDQQPDARNLKGSSPSPPSVDQHQLERPVVQPDIAVDMTPPVPASVAADPVSQLPLNSIYRLSATTIDGETMDLSSLAGKVSLVVNVASK